MYYLGIDPWVRKLWYALIDDKMNILDSWILLNEMKNVTRKDNFQRIMDIYDYFEIFLKKYKIAKVWIEKLFFTKYNQSNAEFVYGIRWALIMLFMKRWIEIHEYTPNEIKKNITWNGSANKILVQQFIKSLFSLKNLPQYDDAADALWLAFLCSRK
jgi:crossover junction endodeoxyribonuclease RuvC